MIAGDHLELSIDKPAAGGRMIARHDGRVILVLGAIPGERVRARVDKVEKSLAFATTVGVLEPSADRREPADDPLCGGCVYSHIKYARQAALKGEVIADAFRRIGRVPTDPAIPVTRSAESGYRMRARLHVRNGAIGFYREGTHDLCDAAPTRQLTDGSLTAVAAAVSSLARDGAAVVSVEIAENIDATERAIHVDAAFGARLSHPALARAVESARLRGCSARTPGGVLMTAGDPSVADPFAALTSGRAASGELRRSAESFFQANRFLLPLLVTAVIDAVAAEGDVLDLYAGAGLFALSLAACGRRGISAVEGDAASGADLKRNAAPFGDAVRISLGSVEDALRIHQGAPRTIIVDPPRSGISKAAMEAVARRGAPRVVYVSCDAATMARDARRLLDAGYRLTSLRGFDLFPNTPHVETFGVFEK